MSDLPPFSGPEGGAGGLNPPAAPSSPYTPPIESPFTPPIAGSVAEPFGPAQNYMPSMRSRARATFGQRFGAYFVDSIITTLFFVPGYIALSSGEKETYRCDSDLGENSAGAFICERPGEASLVAILLLGVALIGMITYYAVLNGPGQTVGKRMLGITVVDQVSGEPIGTGRGIGRFFGTILSRIPCFLGYFWMLWDDDDQTWHDKMASSLVVQD